MGELKQRKKRSNQGGGGVAAKEDTRKRKESSPSAAAPKHDAIQQQPQRKKLFVLVLLFLVYIPILLVVNPSTIPSMYHRITRKPCEGTCSVVEEIGFCSPVDTDRLIFMRIPKTATTTVLKVMERGYSRKNVLQTNIGEVEDLTSSLEMEGAGVDLMGYHDPSPEAYQERITNYYTRASRSILYPPFRAQDKTLFEGHLHYFNFTKNAVRLVGPETFTWLPTWLRAWYNMERPPMVQVEQFTFLRNPQDRLQSMYYYDRHDARTAKWREMFVQARGNVTLEECLLDGKCVETNRLQQWCSIQVEMLCGIGNKCRPTTKHSLELAKQHLNDGILLAGITERMEESLAMLQRLLPTYLEGVSLQDVPREKRSTVAREKKFSPQAQAVLDEICALDMELYNHANQLLTERIEKCE